MAYSGYGTLDPSSIPLARASDALGVFRLTVKDPGRGAPGYSLEPLLNVVPVTVTIREGAHAPMATFRYVFDQDLMPPWLPQRFHHVYGNVKKAPTVVQMDDRLVIVRALDDSNFMYLFDGFVTSPQAKADGQGEQVLMVAHGTPHREWDFPLPGGIHARETGDEDPKVDAEFKRPWFTDIPARFNPLGKGNMCADKEELGGNPEGDEEDENSKKYFHYFTDVKVPAFVTVRDSGEYFLWDTVIGEYTAVVIRQWTIWQAATYIVAMGIEQPLGMNDQNNLWRDPAVARDPYVKVYDINAWDQRLKVIVPKKEGGIVDLKDPETYEKHDVVCPDVEVTGDVWPNALEKIIRPYGFQFRFDLRVTKSEEWQDKMPEWYLTVYRTDDTKNQVDVYLQSPGDVYDPGQTNVAEVDLSQDAYHVGTEFEVDTGLVEFEATFILVPAFPYSNADLGNLEQWVGEHQDKAKRLYYRRFIFGESGEQYWTEPGGDPNRGGTDIFGGGIHKLLHMIYEKNDRFLDHLHTPKPYVPMGRILTKSTGKKPMFTRLDITTKKNYSGKAPGLWDGTGTWQRVTGTEWHDLPDQIGILITARDPNSWHIGKPREGDTVVFDEDGDGLIHLISGLNADNADDRPILALTCVIQSDIGMDALAPWRKSSISRFRVRRKIDAKDRWKRQVITKYSMAAKDALSDADWTTLKDVKYVFSRDDLADAKDGAQGFRRAHEAGSHGGTITIRRLTTAYNVGQVVRKIIGRDVDLKINAGAPKGETPLYPRIQSITWNFDGEQTTTLHLTDERADPLSRRSALGLRPGRQK